jgi:hypothetical protein
MNETNAFRGEVATYTTFAAGVIAWLPILDMALKFGIELLGIYAGFYAARYWHYKWATRKKRNLKDPDTEV